MKNNSEAKTLKSKYKYICAWGRMMTSFDYYITQQCIEANEDNAPIDAIYKNSDGVWQVADEKIKERLQQYL